MQLKVEETGEVFSDKLRAYTLELADYSKMREEDCKTRMDYWLYNLSNMENMTTQIPFQQQQPVFGRVGSIAELVRMSPEERAKYNISIDTYRTSLAVMQNEREEGRAEERTKVALKMKAKGFSYEDIMDCTGLSADQINALS